METMLLADEWSLTTHHRRGNGGHVVDAENESGKEMGSLLTVEFVLHCPTKTAT
jgi:hypothetical protein